MNTRELRDRRAFLRQANREWPAQMTVVDPEQWPPTDQPSEVLGIWRSNRFLAVLYRDAPSGAARLSVQRTQLDERGQWRDGISWDDLQRIKSECGFGNRDAVEIYPKDVDVVNVANLRHLWLLTSPLSVRVAEGQVSRPARSGRPWTEADDAVLRARYADERTAVVAMALQRPLSATYARAQALGLRKSAAFQASPASGRLRREHVRRPWTAAEDALLRARYPDEPTAALAAALGRSLPATYNHAKTLGLVKSETYLASPAACRLRREASPASIATRFKKGQVPANKGLRRPGWAPGRMAETQFKPGIRCGVAVRLWKPIGTERLSKDGYLERKVNDDLPLQARWRAVHLVEWEAVHGRIPAGHALIFKNGDKRDIRLENLELVTRAELMRRNTIHNLPQPLVETIQLLGRVNRQIRKRDRDGQEQDRRPA